MLENTVWRQYHDENNFREKISGFYGVEPISIMGNDKDLYGVLKAKLTKKELKLFAMDSADCSDETIKEEFSYNEEELITAKNKLYKKMKQDKLRYALRASADDSISED